MPTSSNSSLRSLARTSAVSTPSASSSVERLAHQRAARDGDGEGGRAHAALLAGEREVQPVDAEREADGGQVAAEAAEQVVVAPAAAERRAERRVETSKTAPV